MIRFPRSLWIVILLGFLPVVASAETSPRTTPLPEGQVTLITCDLKPESKRVPRVGNERLGPFKDGQYSYKLWVPKGYATQPGRRWPCVFIASPGGKAGMGPMADHLKAADYLVVMLQESSNKGLCEENFLAAHDDVVQRLRVAEGLKFATGLSGGSRASGISVQLRPGFAGLFQQAAGFPYDSKGWDMIANLPKKDFALVTSIGAKDNLCFSEWPRLIAVVPRRTPFLPIITNEGHSWSSKATVARAFLFLEATTLAENPVTNDTRAVAKTWLARHAQITATLPGLADRINFAELAVKAAGKQGLANSPEINALKTELAQWRRDPNADKELKADKTLWEFFARTVPSRLGSKARAEEFKQFARRNEGTAAARQAQIFGEGCERLKK